MTQLQKARYERLITMARELPSGGMMGMFMPDHKEWALMKIEVIPELNNAEIENCLYEWEEYFALKKAKEPKSTTDDLATYREKSRQYLGMRNMATLAFDPVMKQKMEVVFLDWIDKLMDYVLDETNHCSREFAATAAHLAALSINNDILPELIIICYGMHEYLTEKVIIEGDVEYYETLTKELLQHYSAYRGWKATRGLQ